MSKWRRKRSRNRIALRPDSDGLLDDVVVENVSMFRMERMDDGIWWLCCYLADSDERIAWSIHSRSGRAIVDAYTSEYPQLGPDAYEAGSLVE